MINFSIIYAALPKLLYGAVVSIKIAGIGCAIGLTLGTIIALIQRGRVWILSPIASAYVAIIRGTPMLIQITAFFFIFPKFGITLTPFWSAALTLGLNSAAYVSQIIRSGIASVSKGQVEAAKVLGLSNHHITRFIVLPQAIRVVLPALGNEFTLLIKDSSLASVIGVQELSFEGSVIKNMTYDVITAYIAVASIYLVITTTITFFVNRFEQKWETHAKN